jgi:hypothetical protein
MKLAALTKQELRAKKQGKIKAGLISTHSGFFLSGFLKYKYNRWSKLGLKL